MCVANKRVVASLSLQLQFIILLGEAYMAELVVDARGLSCPEPVVRTKKVFDANNAFSVLVDNETAKENVIRFCEGKKAKAEVATTEDGWKISVSK